MDPIQTIRNLEIRIDTAGVNVKKISDSYKFENRINRYIKSHVKLFNEIKFAIRKVDQSYVDSLVIYTKFINKSDKKWCTDSYVDSSDDDSFLDHADNYDLECDCGECDGYNHSIEYETAISKQFHKHSYFKVNAAISTPKKIKRSVKVIKMCIYN